MLSAFSPSAMYTVSPTYSGATNDPSKGKIWCNGNKIMVLRSGVKILTDCDTELMLNNTFLYDSITPLGDPVVPEV